MMITAEIDLPSWLTKFTYMFPFSDGVAATSPWWSLPMELLNMSFTNWALHLDLFLWLNNPQVGFNKYFVEHPLEQFETLWNETHGVAGHDFYKVGGPLRPNPLAEQPRSRIQQIFCQTSIRTIWNTLKPNPWSCWPLKLCAPFALAE